MAKKPDTDPRFDPRFQRGYDGPQPAAPSTPAAPSPLEPTPVAHPDAVDSTAPVDAETPPLVSHEPDAAWIPPRRNPFALALLIGGLAMIAIGAWLVWTIANAPGYPYGQTFNEQLFALVQQELTPAFFIAGTLGIVAWLVLGAMDAARKRA